MTRADCVILLQGYDSTDCYHLKALKSGSAKSKAERGANPSG